MFVILTHLKHVIHVYFYAINILYIFDELYAHDVLYCHIFIILVFI